MQATFERRDPATCYRQNTRIHEPLSDMARKPVLKAFDTSKPDGAPRKLMDSARLHSLGW
jgi:hypothetical protein